MQVNIDYPAVEDELKIVQLVREENKKMLFQKGQEEFVGREPSKIRTFYKTASGDENSKGGA